MTFKEVQLQDILDIQWGDTKTTKASYVSDGYLAYSATGPDGFLEKFDYDREGIVLSAIGANCGSTFFASGKWTCIKNTIRILPKGDAIDLKYFFYMTKEPDFWPIRGSAQPFISQTDIRELYVQIPEINIQKKIGEILFALEEKISANNALSKTLENIAQTIFKSWFIDFDPVKAKMAGEKPAGMDAATAALFPDSMEESELGIVPSGWKVTKLSSSLKLHKSTVKAGASTESVPYVPVDQIGAKDIFLKNSMPGSAAKTSLVSFRKNDILFGAMRPYFHKVVLAPFDGTTRTTTFVLRVINSNYLSHSLFTVNQENAVAFATNNSQGTTIPYAVWNNSFEDFPMVLPTEPTAKAFNDLVLPIIEYGYSLIAQNRSLVEIRNGLLPRLISGELQIPDEMLAS